MAKLYPKQKSVEINPLEDAINLQYVLKGLKDDLSKNDFRLKFAFPANFGIKSQEIKNKVKSILVEIIDASNFMVTPSKEGVLVEVPIRTVSDPNNTLEEEIKIPILIKLSKVSEDGEEEFKCKQEIRLLPSAQETPEDEEVDDDAVEEDGEDAYNDQEQEEDPYADDESEEGDEEGDDEEVDDEGDDEENVNAGLYSGLIAIDYGTSNSSVSVRDPSFASEEVRGQLSEEQWKSLCEWMNIWLSEHLSSVEPSSVDMFVQNLTLVVPRAEIPECGSPKSEIMQALNHIDDKMRVQILSELLSRLANYVKEGSEAKVMKALASETMEGFEAVIDSNNLESQRYFVLELDRNVGPAPISSVLQIIDVPSTEDVATITEETKVDMGARVGLLLHSAAMGEIDIRQFVLSSKRYFGQDDVIEVVPAESNGEAIQIPANILAKLTYKELFNRTVEDIHRRADQGLFQDATWPQTVVATFPTSYPAALRKEIREILTDLEIKEIDTRFDEATAAAIYYIWREIGADPVCGMHGLMARSRKDKYGRAYQNILLYDLGGGTTDIALIQLLYEEVAIFGPDDDRGNGGSYFRITPRLLGTTGHRHLGGDLLTLWVFRLMKSKLADLLMTQISTKNIEAPMDSPINQLMLNLPESIIESADYEDAIPTYRTGSLLEWTIHPGQYLGEYNRLNENVIDILVPTRFENDRGNIPNFFTLWEITDELKKTLGTPIIEHFGTCLGTGLANNWPEEVELDSGQLLSFIQMIHPWLVDSGHITQDDLRMVITQEEMNKVISDAVKQSISLAASLAQARLIGETRQDRVDKLILAGLSCNMKAIQDVAEDVFRESDDIFIYDPENVKFDRDSAKTAVSLGACIGRYMESVRVDPYNEKTRQLLRDGYDQIELVIENLFSYLPCRLAYDSLVAMVPIFEQGQELNCRSYWDKTVSVARTSIKDLRPVQEKFWIYRIDFPGAEPQYLGLINAEAVATENDFEDFRKFREEYVVGFETDSELAIRAFFLPKGQRIIAKDFVESEIESPADLVVASNQTESAPLQKPADYNQAPEDEPEEEPEVDMEDEFDGDELEDDFGDEEVDETEDAPVEEEVTEEDTEEDTEEEKAAPVYTGDDANREVNRTIAVKELLDDIPVMEAGEKLSYEIEYGNGVVKKCTLSNSLSIRNKYEFKLYDPDEEISSTTNFNSQEDDENAIARFLIEDDDETDEATVILDQDGKMVMSNRCLFDIEIWADIEYVAQKVDINYDPFCGSH